MADFHARIFQLQELEQAWQAAVQGLFLTSIDSLASADPDSSSWKTYQLSLFGGLTEFSWNSMRWGMMQDGQLFQPVKWEPRISENESGFLPTPSASEYGTNQGGGAGREGQTPRPSLSTMARKKMWPTPTLCGNYNRVGASATSGDGLETAVRKWPTPLASDGDKDPTGSLSRLMRLWPMPAARDYRSPGSPEGYQRRKVNGHQQALNEEIVHRYGGTGGQLSPMWTEWLMGYPCGWTELSAWATAWFRKPRGKRSCG